MNEGESKPQPEWTMPLHGLPCDHCWEPAKGLVVYKDARFVVHEDPKIKPCRGVNPTPPPPPAPVVLYSKRKAPTARRKVGRPAKAKNTTSG